MSDVFSTMDNPRLEFAMEIRLAFPRAQVFGFDQHEGSIERARANAAKAGAGASFDVVDALNLPKRKFDFISTFDVVHDAVDPVGLMRSIRNALAPGGSYLMLEMNASPNVHENKTPLGRMLYPISTLYCLTTSLAHDGAGIGACMGEPKARELAAEAGFTNFRKLPFDDPFSLLYELRD